MIRDIEEKKDQKQKPQHTHGEPGEGYHNRCC